MNPSRIPLTTLLLAPLALSHLLAQTGPTLPAASTDEPVTLSPFEVRTDKDYGYRKQSTVTTSRIGADIATIPQAIEILSSELLSDFALDDAVQAFRYTSSVLAGEREILQTTTSIMRGFGTQSYYNGLQMARSETAPFFPTDNLDRIEIAKGPVGLFYGNSLPNGIVNYITKKPNFTNATSVTLSGGSYAFRKAVLDTQRVVDKRLGLAYRLIASSQRNEARIDDFIKDYVLLSPSIVFQPWRPLQVSAELNWQKSHNPYPGNANVWQFVFNPQYAEDVANPSRQILDYMRRRFNLADDAAAKAMVVTRWAPVNATTGLTSRTITTWQADMFDLTGVQPFVRSGDKIEWWRFSPRGDKFATQAPQSNFNGNIRTKNVAVFLNPLPALSFNYRWVDQTSRTNFVRSIYQPSTLYRPDGRVDTLTAALLNTIVKDGNRYSDRETQQFDVYYEKEHAGLKHKLNAGMEVMRAVSWQLADLIDYTKVPSRTNRNGVVLTGLQTFQQWDPFLHPLPPNIYDVDAGPPPTFAKVYGKQRDAYVAYRASAFGDRLNLLTGGRHVSDKVTGRSDNTYTFGGIFGFRRGFYAFASIGRAVTLVNQYEGTNLSSVPLPEAKLLNNEKGDGYEVGLKSNWRDSTISGTVSYFENKRDGLVTADYVQNSEDPRNKDGNPNNDVRLWRNGGLQRVRGTEADVIWTPTRALQVVVNAAYLEEAKVISDPSINPNSFTMTYVRAFQMPLARSPRFRLKWVGKYSFDQGWLKNLSVGAGVRYSDMYYISNSTFGIFAPAETLLDTFASYRIKIGRTPTTLQLNLTNLTNQVNDITRDDGFVARMSVTLRL